MKHLVILLALIGSTCFAHQGPEMTAFVCKPFRSGLNGDGPAVPGFDAPSVVSYPEEQCYNYGGCFYLKIVRPGQPAQYEDMKFRGESGGAIYDTKDYIVDTFSVGEPVRLYARIAAKQEDDLKAYSAHCVTAH